MTVIPRQKDPEEDHRLSLGERRAFLKLPLEERRAQLAVQAERMAGHYGREAELADREEWQGGDLVGS